MHNHDGDFALALWFVLNQLFHFLKKEIIAEILIHM